MQELWIQLLDQQDLLEEEMQPTPVFLPGKSYRQRSLAGTVRGSGWGGRVGHKRVRHDLETQQQQPEFSHQPVSNDSSFNLTPPMKESTLNLLTISPTSL